VSKGYLLARGCRTTSQDSTSKCTRGTHQLERIGETAQNTERKRASEGDSLPDGAEEEATQDAKKASERRELTSWRVESARGVTTQNAKRASKGDSPTGE
jgi:hypothetical protein